MIIRAATLGDVPEIAEVHVSTWQTCFGKFHLRNAVVLDTNERARQFYERLGWQADGRVKVDDRGSFALTELRYAIPLS